MSLIKIINFYVYLFMLTIACEGTEPLCQAENAETSFINRAKNVSKLQYMKESLNLWQTYYKDNPIKKLIKNQLNPPQDDL